MHHRICRSTASRSPLLTRAGICVPPTVTYLPYRVSGSTLTDVGRSQLLAQWPGTLFRILSGISRAAQTVLGVYVKRTCSRNTSASSALGVLTIMHYTNYALTHSQKATRWPCGVCGRGVGSNSIQCTSCQKWEHKKCSGIKGGISKSD